MTTQSIAPELLNDERAATQTRVRDAYRIAHHRFDLAQRILNGLAQDARDLETASQVFLGDREDWAEAQFFAQRLWRARQEYLYAASQLSSAARELLDGDDTLAIGQIEQLKAEC